MNAYYIKTLKNKVLQSSLKTLVLLSLSSCNTKVSLYISRYSNRHQHKILHLFSDIQNKILNLMHHGLLL